MKEKASWHCENLTFEERLHNAIGAQEIEQVKAWHAYTHGMGYSKESRMYFDRQLRKCGLFERLEEMGIEKGDTVSIYDIEFDYEP